MNTTVFKRALTMSLPVMGGYLVLGFAFGLLAVSSGIPWYFTTIMSLVVFAGSAQFVLVGLLAKSAPLMSIMVTILLVNSRHLFYGISFIGFFRTMERYRPYMIFSLTDETYAILSLVRNQNIPEKEKRELSFSIAALDQSYWVIGSTIGALFISFIPFDTSGVEFSMTALFTVILIEQLKSGGHLSIAAAAVVSGTAFLLLFGAQAFLLPSLFFMLFSLLFVFSLGRRRNVV